METFTLKICVDGFFFTNGFTNHNIVELVSHYFTNVLKVMTNLEFGSAKVPEFF